VWRTADTGREIALLTNPNAGGGVATRYRDVALGRLRSSGFEVRNLQGRNLEEAIELGRQCVSDGVEAIVVCGGDGAASAGIQAVVGTEAVLGLVPAGTGNDLARCLGLPRHDPSAAADVIIAGRTRSLDLGRIDLGAAGFWYFGTVLAAGFDSMVNERADRMGLLRGRARYHLATLATLRRFSPTRFDMKLTEGGRETEKSVDCMLVAIGNSQSYGGGLRITHEAIPDDGLLDLVAIGRMTRRRLIRTYPKLSSGQHVAQPEYSRVRVTRVTVAAPGITAYADGERIGPLPLTVDCAPAALTVLA
jgi:diacylglycerol kinase (ATP)